MVMSLPHSEHPFSLEKYGRQSNLESSDFCNSFWGLNDEGVDVLFARMQGGIQTLEEVKGFLLERALIEEEYSRKLTNLANMHLGVVEIGNTKDSLNVMKRETVKHATDHLYLASKLRNGVRGAATEIESRVQLVRAKQRAIQKELKEKQEKEHQAAQSKHKYAEDCKKLKDLEAESESQVTQVDERATLALVEKVKDDITVSQREFAGLTGSLTAAAEKWVSSWKAFCDLCQTLEEDRLDEVKKLSRDYAGAISEVCIADDKACKVIRTSLDLWSPEEENRLFVHKYGSGERIKEPVAFIDFQRDDSLESYLESTTREADFIRLKPDFQTEVEAVTSGHGVEFGTQTSSEVKPSSSKDSAPNDPRSEANLGEPFS